MVNKPHGIIVFGANGSGKTTLGNELAQTLKYKHMDIEDYYFEKSEIPYAVEHSHDECLSLLLADIEKYGSFILTAVTGDFGDKIPQLYEFAVYISTPIEIRMARIKQRSYKQHGKRICKGGDMYEQEQQFFDFVASRSLSRIEQWATTLTCPVVHVDGTVNWHINVASIVEQYYLLCKNKYSL